MSAPPAVMDERNVIGLGEYLGCFVNGCADDPVGVAIFGAPASPEETDRLKTTVIRFCPDHEIDAYDLTHAWDPEVFLFPVDIWEAEHLREQLFPLADDEALEVTTWRQHG